jgi:hypothetical protein
MGLGSGIRKKLIPDPEVKKHQIQDPDSQHRRKGEKKNVFWRAGLFG